MSEQLITVGLIRNVASVVAACVAFFILASAMGYNALGRSIPTLALVALAGYLGFRVGGRVIERLG